LADNQARRLTCVLIQSILAHMTTLTPQAFVDKWRHVDLKERAACQEHFIDLCRPTDHPAPAEDDPTANALRLNMVWPNRTAATVVPMSSSVAI
jgi:hypothetical protein